MRMSFGRVGHGGTLQDQGSGDWEASLDPFETDGHTVHVTRVDFKKGTDPKHFQKPPYVVATIRDRQSDWRIVVKEVTVKYAIFMTFNPAGEVRPSGFDFIAMSNNVT